MPLDPSQVQWDAPAPPPIDHSKIVWDDAPKKKPTVGPESPTIFNNSYLTGIKDAAEPVGQLVSGLGDAMGMGMRALGIPTRDTSKPLPANVTVPFYPSGAVQDDSYQPKTVAGHYARTLGQFTPGAVAGPEGAIARVLSVALPGIASETAGQLTAGTKAEKYARVLGALAGSGLVGPASRGASSLVNLLKGGAPAAESAVDAVAPSISQLKSTAGDAYDSVFKDPTKNVIISKDALSDLADNVKSIATEHGFKPELNPKAAVVINDVLSLPKDNSTLAGLELTRRLAGNVAKDYGTSDGALASKIKASISDFMSNLDDGDIIGTEAGGTADLSGVDALKNARANWATMRKAEIIQSIQDNAEIRGAANYTQAGSDTALRRGFANLATNTKKLAQFTPDEQDAIRLVAKGDMSANAMRFLGKFAIRGPVSGMAASGIGHLLGGPVGPYVLGGIGEAARAGASSATQNNVNALSALVRGGPTAAQNLTVQRQADLIKALQNFAPAALAATPALATAQQ